MTFLPEQGCRRLLPLVILLACTIYGPWWLLALQSGHLSNDFSVFWAAANVSPDLIYNDAAITAKQADLIPSKAMRPWAYPPTTLLPLLPFGMLPYKAALISFAGLTATVFLLACRPYFGERKLIAYGLVILSQPFMFAAVNGQLVFLVGAMVLAGLAILPTAPIRAGVLFGIAAAIKPQILVFAPLAMVADRQYRALAASTLACGSMVLASLALGADRWLEWVAAVGRFPDTVERSGILYRNITPTGILWHLGVPESVRNVANLAFAGVAAWAGWQVFRSTSDLPVRLLALVGGAIFTSPYMMNYDLVLLVPSAVVLIFRGQSTLLSALLLLTNGYYVPPATVAFIVYNLPLRIKMRRREVSAFHPLRTLDVK